MDDYDYFLSRLVYGPPTKPASPPPGPQWTRADGSKVAVRDMTDAHLHFALAKAYRGEYATVTDRKTGIEALKREAARRLVQELLG